MWSISGIVRFGDHMIGSDDYHGPWCTLCRIAKNQGRRAGPSLHPVSRDLACGPGRHTKRVLALENRESSLTALFRDHYRYRVTPFDQLDVDSAFGIFTDNSSKDDLLLLITPYPIPTMTEDVKNMYSSRIKDATIITVYTTPRRPQADDEDVIGYFTEGLPGDHMRIEEELYKLIVHAKYRLPWDTLDAELRKAIPTWETYATTSDRTRRFFGF